MLQQKFMLKVNKHYRMFYKSRTNILWGLTLLNLSVQRPFVHYLWPWRGWPVGTYWYTVCFEGKQDTQSSFFPLGSFSLCFRKHLSLTAYCTIPVLDHPTFSTSSALPPPLSRESWSCKPVNYMFPTFATIRLSRDPYQLKVWDYVGEKCAGKFSLKMPDFHVAFRWSFTCQ
jgi:hypothetical protein